MSSVVFWSPVQGRGTSSHLFSSALMIALSHHVRLLTMHTDIEGSSIEAALPLKDNTANHITNLITTTGWDALLRLYISGSLTRDKFRDCTVPLYRQLDMLPGARGQNYSDIKDAYINYVSPLLKAANEAYDLVLLDAGNQIRMERNLLKDVDVVIINLDQNLRVLERYLDNKEIIKDLEDKKVIVTLGQYDPESSCTISNIKRRFGYKGQMIGIPYCTEYKDAWNRRDVSSYMQQNMNLDKKNGRKGEHAASIRELAKAIMDNAGLRTILKQLERGA